MAKIITVATPKGGVGKTTVACHLATLFGRKEKTLFIDIDSQGNSTKYFLKGGKLPDENNIVGLFRKEPPDPMKVSEKLDLVGSNLHLSEFDSRNELSFFFLLSKYLKKVSGAYENIIIDTPPNLGMFTLNALLATELVISVVDPSEDAIDGLCVLIDTISDMREDHNGRIKLLGLVLNAFDERNRADRRILDQAREKFGDLLFDAKIPRTTRIRDARAEYRTVLDSYPDHASAQAFEALYKEIKKRIKS